ncbi:MULTISPECIES: PadR family transcriptional regulator [Clostridium]|uniref:PadR family transcriptional regulator n=1 Tax=Clostridium paridis TaxID=2803863 RepID=A0A937FDW3_9CLOT|nr:MULTISPECIES: PadR family transcriptional regulator [Clostridium]MBL4932225.1 PadR family transcriptional regulator [Clostridium paridis]MDD7793103.1 PadR family transcriptional regulator [Clostridium sp. 'White wine YQ']
MNNKSQLLKGSLEGCVLKIIDLKEEIYGYEIARLLKENGFSDISEGTLYPLYTRLQKNGLITSTMKASAFGPARKYYKLTDKGVQELNDFLEAWGYLTQNINAIINGDIE